MVYHYTTQSSDKTPNVYHYYRSPIYRGSFIQRITNLRNPLHRGPLHPQFSHPWVMLTIQSMWKNASLPVTWRLDWIQLVLRNRYIWTNEIMEMAATGRVTICLGSWCPVPREVPWSQALDFVQI